MDDIGIKLLPFTIEEKIEKINYTIPYGIELINAKNTWSKGYTGKGVTIAIIDTGCDTKHIALKDRIIGGKNFTNDDNSNPNIYEDYQGHGTHVAGTIAANFSKSGVTGVAPNASLLILKALDKNGGGRLEWVIDAIDYAIYQKVDIISMSLGSSVNEQRLHDAVARAAKSNVSIVCAAGNRGDNNINRSSREYDYPGAYDEVIEVGAIDSNKNAANFSDSNEFIDLVAPGVGILSTYKNGGYATLSGTSMAAPHVTGALALLIEWSRKEFERNLKVEELYAQLIKCTKALSMERIIQGNGYLFLDLSVTK